MIQWPHQTSNSSVKTDVSTHLSLVIILMMLQLWSKITKKSAILAEWSISLRTSTVVIICMSILSCASLRVLLNYCGLRSFDSWQLWENVTSCIKLTGRQAAFHGVRTVSACLRLECPTLSQENSWAPQIVIKMIT